MRILNLAVLLVLAGVARADEVHLKSGGKLTGKVTEEGDKVTIVRGNNLKVTLHRDQIERIVYTKDDPAPPAEPSRKDTPPPAGAYAKTKFTAAGGGTLRVSTVDRWFPLPGGKYLLARGVTGSDCLVRVEGWTAPPLMARSIAPLPDGKRAFVSWDKGVRLSEIEGELGNGVEFLTPNNHCLTATPDGKLLVGSRGTQTVAVWSVAAYPKPPLHEIQHPDKGKGSRLGGIVEIGCPDSKTAVAFAPDGLIRVFDLQEGKPGPSLSIPVVPVIDKPGTLPVKWTRDFRRFVVAEGSEVAVYDSRTLKLERKGKLALPASGAWRISPSGKFLISQSPEKNDREVRVFSLTEMKELGRWASDRIQEPQYCDFAVSLDDRYLAVANLGTQVFILALPGLQPVADLHDANATVRTPGFSLDGKAVLAAGVTPQSSWDGLCVWSVEP